MFRILIDQQILLSRIAELARQLRRSHAQEPFFCVVLDGAGKFAEILFRDLQGLVRGESFDTIKLESYGSGGTESSGSVRIVEDLSADVRGRRIVVLEDIVDTGRTVDFLIRLLERRGAASVEVYTLLSKPSRRVVDVPLEAVGFDIPNEFVIGFGMDLDGKYRDLPHVAVYEEQATEVGGG